MFLLILHNSKTIIRNVKPHNLALTKRDKCAILVLTLKSGGRKRYEKAIRDS